MAAPWILMGDFNVILNPEEIFDYVEGLTLTNEEVSFSECVKDLEVIDCSYVCPSFIWTNKQTENFITMKLRRVLVNEIFMITYPTASSTIKEPRFSDHCACIMEFGQPFKLQSGAFNFFQFFDQAQRIS